MSREFVLDMTSTDTRTVRLVAPGPTAKISGAAAATKFADLPKGVIGAAKTVILDTVGVSIAGTRTESFSKVVALIRAEGRAGKSSVFCTGLRTTPEWAALANAVAAHALDFDDWHGAGGVHPGTVVVPTALAVAEETGATGEELIASVVAGYETMIRVGILCGRNGFRLGFMPTSTCGVFGAMATAANLRGLDAETVERGMGIAASLCSGINCYMFAGGAPVKHFQVGWAVHSGIVAARLAAAGYDAPRGSLEGRNGFCQTYGAGDCNTGELESALKRYEIRNVQLKEYPCCSELFTSIEAVTSLAREHDISPDAIQAIRVRATRIAAENCSQPLEMKVAPPSVSDARFSLPFVVSLALTEGSVDMKRLDDSALRDTRLTDLARKVEARVDPELERLFPKVSAAEVELVTVRGSFKTRLDHPKGSPERPMTRHEVLAKFRDCAEYGGLDDADAVAAALLRLESSGVSDILRTLVSGLPSNGERSRRRR